MTGITDVPTFTYPTNLSAMFMNDSGRITTNITTINNLENWDMSKVTNTRFMFWGCVKFNQNIGNWDVSNVTNMESMFESYDNRTTLFNNGGNPSISGWNVSHVTNMNSMFNNAAAFNQDLSHWCVTNIPLLPNQFDRNTTSWTLPKPIWGTCP